MKPREIIVLAAALGAAVIIVAALLLRYELHVGGENGYAWRLDRFTGAVQLCAPDRCLPNSK